MWTPQQLGEDTVDRYIKSRMGTGTKLKGNHEEMETSHPGCPQLFMSMFASEYNPDSTAKFRICSSQHYEDP